MVRYFFNIIFYSYYIVFDKILKTQIPVSQSIIIVSSIQSFLITAMVELAVEYIFGKPAKYIIFFTLPLIFSYNALTYNKNKSYIKIINTGPLFCSSKIISISFSLLLLLLSFYFFAQVVSNK